MVIFSAKFDIGLLFIFFILIRTNGEKEKETP